MGDAVRYLIPAGKVFFSQLGGREVLLGRCDGFHVHVNWKPEPWMYRLGDDLLKLPRRSRIKKARLAHVRR